MAACWVCVPSCEKCKPKKVVCSACGAVNLFHAEACASCGEAITDAARAQARREWEAAAYCTENGPAIST